MGMDISFQEVTGLEHEVETEEVAAGGENAYKIKYPGRMKYNNIVMKRGHAPGGGMLWTHFQMRFFPENGIIAPIFLMDLEVDLVDEKENPVTSWTIKRAYPVKWNVGGLNSMDSKFLVESIEFAHHGIMVY